jgi:Sulfotransferase domain.
VSDFAPFFEIDPHWNENGLIPDIQKRHEQLGRRVFNTHLRGDMLPHPIEMGKFIYITRSPLDTCVSFYHHLTNQVEGGYNGSLDEFFHEWIKGELPFGSWMDHFCSYSPLVARNQILHLCFEEMVTDLPKCVEAIMDFLELDNVLTKDDVMNVLPSFEFTNMRNHLDKFQPKSVSWKNDFRFLRRGCVGDYKNNLTSDQVVLFKNDLVQRQLFQKLDSIFSGSDTGRLENFTLCLKEFT